MRRKVTLNEKQLKNIIKESVRRILNEMEDEADYGYDNYRRSLSVRKFEENPDYEIVKINSFDEARKYSPYTSWSVTKSRQNYDSYTDNGNNQFYFCLQNGFENNKDNMYALSMLAILVSPEGELLSCTNRTNNDQHALDEMEISRLLGCNFYETFKPSGYGNNGMRGFNESRMRRFGSSRPSMARRRLVVENAINNSWRSARKMVISRFGYSKEEAEKILDEICSMFRLNHEMVKFIKGCARMYLNGEFNDQQVLSNFIDALNIIKNDGHVGEFDSDLRRLDQPAGTVNSAKDIIGFFESEIDMKYNPTVTEHRHNGRMRSEHPYIGFERRRRY